MLNELHRLSATLESAGISLTEWHNEYKPLPNVTLIAPCIRVWLSNGSSIHDIETIDAELAQTLRKFGNNQGTFPAFNIVPLYRMTDRSQICELERLEKDTTELDIDKIKSWCENDNWQSSIINKVNRSLHKVSQKLLSTIGIQQQPEYKLISELIRSSDAFSSDSNNSFRSALEKCIFAKLQKQEAVNLMLSMLFHKGDPAKTPKNDTGTSISIVLDLFEWQPYGYPVTNKHTTEWINEMLRKSDQAKAPMQSESDEKDAFGSPFVNVDEPMPSVKLDGFDVTLRSMFNGQPCQYRYRKIDDASYPITKENRSLAKKSMEWVAASERKGITWQKVDKNEVVFVYPSKLSSVPVKFVSIFSENQIGGPSQAEARFENIAKEFIKTLKGLPSTEKPDSIQVITIRKMDQARSKVIFTQNCSPEQLIQSAEEWENGCKNLPTLDVGEIIIPFPLQVARIVNNVWKQNGELAQGKAVVKRMKDYQGMELLLDIMQESMTYNFLHILLTNSSGLINYIGNCVNGGSVCKDKAAETKLKRLRKETGILFPVLGLFLYKHNERKENYMENMAFLVGRLLKISDELHTLYCIVVRNGDVPPQLAGSALFVTAGETPNRAISQLSVRMNPYITWGKQYRYKNITTKYQESWKAAWYLKLFEETANKLSEIISDTTRFNDYEKAQLFIGYLSTFPKREQQITNIDDEMNTIDKTGGANDE